ncbi:hypothetical protein KNT87_gp203 [Erwinia phage Cronus]|uniref:Uncharacterized protein n=1 Tax=Erwinia phage Cronus TaxID=2163633 RepID=A0A2S1GLW0_9CAUD|nr:hypothetical protein KNT87_gp203 [Erwinia phage Cronus]AWD90366.1 hypothetical protein [Erwinia phage Cronus]
MKNLEIIENETLYDMYIYYKTPAEGNWTDIPEGWKLHRKGLTKEVAVKDRDFMVGLKCQTVFGTVKLVEVKIQRKFL